MTYYPCNCGHCAECLGETTMTITVTASTACVLCGQPFKPGGDACQLPGKGLAHVDCVKKGVKP